MDGRRRRRGRNQLHSLPEQARRRAGAAHRRRVKPIPSWPSSPPTAITTPTGTGKPWIFGATQIENAIRDLKRRGVEPSPLEGAWLAVQVIAHNLARWTARGLGEQLVTTKPLGDASFPWPEGSPARRAASPCICPRAGPGRTSVAPWHDSARCLSRPDGARSPLTQLPRTRARSGPRVLLAVSSRHLAHHSHAGRYQKRRQTAGQPPIYPNSSPNRASVTLHPPSAILAPSVDSGLMVTMISWVKPVNPSHPYLENDPAPSFDPQHLRKV